MNKLKLLFLSLVLMSAMHAADTKPMQPVAESKADPAKADKIPDDTFAAVSQGAKEMMIIPPHARAQDFKEAFDLLKRVKSQDKITFFLKDKSKISGILDVDVLPGGTMLNFKINTTQGVRYQIVRVEDVNSVML
jgi:hypothetical protein